jgi:hypothetical protein
MGLESLGSPIIAGIVKAFSELGSRRDEARKALHEARFATLRYEARWRKTGERDEDEQIKLAELWTKLGDFFEVSDPELAMRIRTKGKYWLGPEKLTDADIRRLGIGLDSVVEDAGEKLRKKGIRGRFLR